MPTTFTPMNTGFAWTDALTGAGGTALPTGETPSSVTIGIRPDGNATYSLGHYQYTVIVPAPATTESIAALNTAIATTLPPGNYWANAMQTDAYNGSSFTSAWGATEVPFGIVAPGVAPDAPALSVS